ncbi:hypothetical protein EG68_02389 [Paragonimus skrjabini miyazakii]|uniref:Uncharacterized protein n=1 Tax=Paragonimus skrjabini miyazakii TaxID=59628 RepID=A0A8S9Z466_9TREM|nr:hypothetical protein EG68_02389 [Paragonimus skrjabini miyazakii]
MSEGRGVGVLSPSSTKKSEEIYRKELEAIHTELDTTMKAVEGSLENMEKKIAAIFFLANLFQPGQKKGLVNCKELRKNIGVLLTIYCRHIYIFLMVGLVGIS